MKIRNVSNNTIFIEDLDLHIPYDDQKPYEVEPILLKKSPSLRAAILGKLIEIVEHNEKEQIEKSLSYLKKKQKPPEEEKPTEKEVDPKGIEVKIHGIFYEAGGYAKVNRYLAKNLHKLGVRVKISPKKGQNHLNADELQDVVALENTQLSKNHICIDSIVPSFSEMSSSRYNILYTTVESYSLPKQFVECCSHYNEIWVISDFCKEIVEKYVPDKPIFVVPDGVDPVLYNENVEPVTFNPPLKKFVFLSVFGWSYRKGYDLLFKSYFDAFSDGDNVSLLVFSRYMQGTHEAYKSKIQEDIDKITPNRKNLPHYKVVSKIVPEQLMPQIYRACQAFVLPTRGDGFALPPCEASLCGLPVIMTNVSGQRMYLRNDNSFLVEMDKLEPMSSSSIHLHYWCDQLFPALRSEKCVKDLAGLMRQVVEEYDEAKNRNQRLQSLLLQNFSWESSAKTAFDRLKTIAERIRN